MIAGQQEPSAEEFKREARKLAAVILFTAAATGFVGGLVAFVLMEVLSK